MMARRKGSTNSVHVKYTEIIDLQTVAGKTSVIGIHTPCTVDPIKRLSGLYSSFRFVKYNGARLNMIPAANLPVDPLGLTGVVGTTDTMDPRDALNPILSHGCHGEHLGKILDTIYSESVSTPIRTGNVGTGENSSSAVKLDFENASDSSLSKYYQCLTDVTWKKHGIQAPLSMKMYPLVNRLASSMPLIPGLSFNAGTEFRFQTGKLDTMKSADSSSPVDLELDHMQSDAGSVVPEAFGAARYRVSTTGFGLDAVLPQFFTSGVTRMGWLPTTRLTETGATTYVPLPKQFMSVLVMPPAYNIEQFFRMSITHSYSFAGFTTSLGGSELDAGHIDSASNSYFNWIDYEVTSKDTGSKYCEGTTLDLIDADAKTIADGVR